MPPSTSPGREGKLDQAFPTILVASALTTILTGLAFWALGALKLGKSKSLAPLPPHQGRPSLVTSEVSSRNGRGARRPVASDPQPPTHSLTNLIGPLAVSTFVPRHVLLGCIGGLGAFIASEGKL